MGKGSSIADSRREEPSPQRSPSASALEVIRDVGAGKGIALIRDAVVSDDIPTRLYDAIVEKFSRSMRVIEFSVGFPLSGTQWKEVSAQLEDRLLERGIRHCPFIGSNNSSVVVQHLAITRPKLSQSLVLLNPVLQVSPSFSKRTVSRIEGFLPLGLPLRMGGDHFVSTPFLHRIRCPALVVASSGVSEASAKEMISLAHRMPTAWYWELSGLCAEDEMVELVRKFLLVRHRCPMRRVQGS